MGGKGSTKWETGAKHGGRESSPIVADIELFCSIQEEVGFRAVAERGRNLFYASLQDLWVEHRAVRPGEASLVWRSVERASAALTLARMTSILDRLIATISVNSGVFRHHADIER